MDHRMMCKPVEQDLIDKVIKQIRDDLHHGDLSALEDLLSHTPEKELQSFLSGLEVE